MIPRKATADKGLAVFALLAIVVFLVGAVFLAMGIVDFVVHWRRASIAEWVLFLPLVLYLIWKLLSPLSEYAQAKGWIPASLTRRMNTALTSQGQSPLGKFVLGAAMVCLVAVMFFQSFTFWILFLALAYAGILADVVWAFVTAGSRKPH